MNFRMTLNRRNFSLTTSFHYFGFQLVLYQIVNNSQAIYTRLQRLQISMREIELNVFFFLLLLLLLFCAFFRSTTHRK